MALHMCIKLFNDGISRYIMSNTRIISDQWIGKYVERTLLA